MSISNPDTWTSPKWHSDFGNAEEETARLRGFAKVLLKQCPEVQVNLEEPEEGYLYVDVIHEGRTVAEVYCVKDPDNPQSLRFGIFVFDGTQERESYCSTEMEAVKVIEPFFHL